MIGNNLLKFHNPEVSVMTKRLFVPSVEYDEQFDNCQEREDDWVSSVIGSDADAIYDVLSEIK